MPNKVLHHALGLAARGPVFPCKKDKTPHTQHGFKDASCSAVIITEWWTRWPDALIGVPTGINFDVLDADLQHVAARQWFAENKHRIPIARTHVTRSGGRHLLFRRNAAVKCSAGLIAPNIDTRGLGGYIIWWPENIREAANAGKCSYIYQFGDHDPSGCLIPKIIEERLTDFCWKHDVPSPMVERIALTPQQIARYELPSRPTKRAGNTHAKQFKGRSTELDALPPNVLRALVRESIERHLSPANVKTLRIAEDSERMVIQKFAQRAQRQRH